MVIITIGMRFIMIVVNLSTQQWRSHLELYEIQGKTLIDFGMPQLVIDYIKAVLEMMGKSVYLVLYNMFNFYAFTTSVTF